MSRHAAKNLSFTILKRSVGGSSNTFFMFIEMTPSWPRTEPQAHFGDLADMWISHVDDSSNVAGRISALAHSCDFLLRSKFYSL